MISCPVENKTETSVGGSFYLLTGSLSVTDCCSLSVSDLFVLVSDEVLN